MHTYMRVHIYIYIYREREILLSIVLKDLSSGDRMNPNLQ